MAVTQRGKSEFRRLAKSKKFRKVMGEFGKGKLHHGGSGKIVPSDRPDIARAIAARQAEESRS